MTALESRIVTSTLERLAALGYKPVMANDGGDDNYPCTTIGDALEAIRGTGMAHIFLSKGGERRGWILFIEGNGEDIVSDFTSNLPERAIYDDA